MKMNGVQVNAHYIETVVIPRGNIDYVFKARPLTKADTEAFEKLFPIPQAPTFVVPGGGKKVDVENKDYIELVEARSMAQTEYMFFVSLDATDWIEWETVDEADPSTWGNIKDELTAAGFLEPEVVRVFNIAVMANGLDQSKIDIATQSFLAGQAEVSN